MATTLELAQAIASQPAMAVQATLRAIWAARELAPSQAKGMAPALIAHGMSQNLYAEGQQDFENKVRVKPKLR